MRRTAIGFLCATMALPLVICAQAYAEQDAQAVAQPCAAADALLQAAYLDDAKKAYVALLSGDKQPACAREGLLATQAKQRELSHEHCAKAQALFDSGYLDEAKEAYLKLLGGDSSPVCAREGLVSVSEQQRVKRGEEILRARQLAGFGLHDKAKEIIEKQLKDHDQVVVPPDLQYLSGGKIPGWRAARRDLDPWARPALEILAGVVLIVLFARMMRLVFRRIAKRCLVIEEFDTSGLEDKMQGKGFSTVLRTHLNRLASGSRRGRLALVTGPVEDIKIPAEVEAAVPAGPVNWLSPLTWVKAVPALLNWLVPHRVVYLKGCLHQSGSRGVGMTLRLVQGDADIASYTFWQRDFDDSSEPSHDDPADCYYQLAEYAAIWLLFETAEKFGSGITLLGTRDWRSYAYFRAGYFAKHGQRKQAARNLYIRALQLDPAHRGARVNLARWYIDSREPEAALEQLLRAREDSRNAVDSDRDPTLYSALYNLAMLKYDRGDVRDARVETGELIDLIDTTLSKIAAGEKGYADTSLKYHLETIRPVASTMLGGLKAELGDPDALDFIRKQTTISSVFPLHQYNLACCYSILAKRMPPVTPAGVAEPASEKAARHEQYLQASLGHLRRSFQLDAGFSESAPDDPALDYLQLKKDKEFAELFATFQRPGSVLPKPEPPLPLAEVATIGKAHAKRLDAERVRTSNELLQAALNPAARQALAAKLNVTLQLVTKWAHAMDLLRIVGLTPALLSLLDMAGVHRLSDLASSNPASLKALLDDIGKATGLSELPDLATVGAWVEDARTNTLPKVT